MNRCPYCHQALPEPPERFCPSCGGDLQAAPPAAGSAGGGTGGTTPWERRDRLGVATALVETTREVLFSPTDFFRAMPVTGGIGAPLGYAMILGGIAVVATAVYQLVFRTLGASLAGLAQRGGPFERVLPLFAGGVGFVAQILLGPLVLLAGLFVASAIIHVVLMLFGGALKGFEATFRVVCYSEATALFQLIPLCGGFIAGIYWIILAIIGLAEAHGIGKGIAAAAVLIPIVLLCCCCGLFFALMFGSLASLISHAQ